MKLMIKLLPSLTFYLSCVHTVHSMSTQDVQSLIGRIQSSLGINTVRGGRRTNEITQDCNVLETQLYNNTKIASAEFLTFTFSKTWTKPSFDLDAFFANMHFTSECERMGGEVAQVDIKLEFDRETVTLNNYKLCKPSVCDKFEYLLTKRMMYDFFEPYIKCNIDLVSDEIPSQQCLDGMTKTYNNTAFSSYSPEAFLMEGGAFKVEEEGYCEEEEVVLDGEKKWDAKICDMSIVEPDHDTFTKMCESEDFGGTILPMNIVYNAPSFHRTFYNFPYCKPTECTIQDINGWYDYLVRVYNKSKKNRNGDSNNDSTVIEHTPKKVCEENKHDLALMKKKRNKAIVQSCDWLSKRPDFRKRNYCREKDPMKGYEPAYKVCPLTCCTCVEGMDDVFVRKVNVDKSDKLKLVTRTCGWLQSVEEKTRKNVCRHSLPSLGGYSDARTICPNTCEVCLV